MTTPVNGDDLNLAEYRMEAAVSESATKVVEMTAHSKDVEPKESSMAPLIDEDKT